MRSGSNLASSYTCFSFTCVCHAILASYPYNLGIRLLQSTHIYIFPIQTMSSACLSCHYITDVVKQKNFNYWVVTLVVGDSGYVIVVSWVSRVYGICTLSVVICIPKGEVREGVHTATRRVQTIHPRNPWYTWCVPCSISQCFPGGPLATARALVVLATIHPRVYGKMKGCARVYRE